jgi:hypothetical protein
MMAVVVNPPVMGVRARRACALPVEGEKRRRLLVLLAAFADGNDGVCRPSTGELLGRIPAMRDAKKLFGVARRLEEDGYIRLVRGRGSGGGWELLFLDADRAGGDS